MHTSCPITYARLRLAARFACGLGRGGPPFGLALAVGLQAKTGLVDPERVERDDLRERVVEAWRFAAPEKLLAELDEI
jgi:hypothetical protein